MYQTRSVTGTTTQAKRLASHIGAELMQVQSFYGRPSDAEINDFVTEAELYLAAGYLETVSYGFLRNDEVVFELSYTAAEATAVNDKPGRVPPDKDVSGCSWFSFLRQSAAWWKLSSAQREAFREKVPIKRSFGAEPVKARGLRSAGSKQFSEETLGLRRDVKSL